MKNKNTMLLGNYLIANRESLKILSMSLFLIGSGMTTQAQEVTTSYTSNTTFTVPVGVTSLKVECWGGGGKGSDVSSAATGTGGGGGGGAYSSAIVCVLPGESYAITIGAGGSGATENGGDTYFGSTSTVMAKGGKGLTLNVIAAGAGGLASESVGTTKYNGGNGAAQSTYAILVDVGYRSGAGGGGAGSTGAGNNALTVTGGASRTENGGAGGAGTDAALLSALGGFSGIAGANYGGGGSGAGKGLLLSQPSYAGGNGAPGIIRITYEAYVCNATLTTTWNGSSWSNGSPSACKKVIIAGNYNTGIDGSITACSIQVNTGSTLTIGTANYAQIYNEITNNGTINVANIGSLVQQYSVKSNTGNIRAYRNSQPMYRYDYTYWSAPVTGVTLAALSPTTLLDKYLWWNASSQSWAVSLNGTEAMVAGKGYIVRAPQTYSLDPAVKTTFQGIFEGPPNNGTITYAVSGDATGTKYNLLGNPYPSAINAESFMSANSSVLGGTIYFWTHSSVPVLTASGTYAYADADYATYNFSGGTAAGSGPAPGNKIGSGQSFFIGGTANGTATFNNSMRLLNDNSQFYRSAPSAETVDLTGKHRFWLNFSSGGSQLSQILVGYIENATDGLDWGYDGETMSSDQVSLYSILGDKKLSIQGKALPFNMDDMIPLGYMTSIEGTFEISIDHFDDLFLGHNIFIKDNLLGVVHNLKDGLYSFTSAIGTFEDRFQIVYVNTALGNTEFEAEQVVIYKNKQADVVVDAGSNTIDEIKVFDISGRRVYEAKKINNTETILENLPSQQVLIVDVVTSEGYKITQKVIF